MVGVGASAGGLEAFTQLLQHLPSDTGMAFVLVQHLHPGYASVLTDILTRETSMPVVEATDNQRVEPNHLYVIPPNAHLVIKQGRLRLLPRPQEQGHILSIDQFFRTLAEEQGSRAIGIILSGNASDGVLGLKAIKGMGGITFVQEEKTCKYPGMPQSVIAAGCADLVLSPQKIARELVHIARHPYLASASLPDHLAAPSSTENHFNKIFFLLRRYSAGMILLIISAAPLSDVSRAAC